MASTIHDVAALAGVNSSTVSRVLNGKATVTPETKDRIYQAMQQLDYHPNSVARSLASGLSGAIGLVVDAEDVDAFSNVFFSRSLIAIEQVAQARNYNVIITNGAKHATNAIENLMLERKVDGLILPPSTAKPTLIKKISNFPCVLLGQPNRNNQMVSWVDVNNEQGAHIAVKHLLSKGYEHIAFLGGEQKTGFVRRRIRGYCSTITNKNTELIVQTNSTTDDAYNKAIKLLRNENRPDAVLCNDNISAFGLLKAAKKLCIGVPNQLGIITFDNEPLAKYMDPPLSVVSIDTAMLGEQTAQLLFQIIDNKRVNQQVLLSATLIQRESTNRT